MSNVDGVELTDCNERKRQTCVHVGPSAYVSTRLQDEPVDFPENKCRATGAGAELLMNVLVTTEKETQRVMHGLTIILNPLSNIEVARLLVVLRWRSLPEVYNPR